MILADFCYPDPHPADKLNGSGSETLTTGHSIATDTVQVFMVIVLQRDTDNEIKYHCLLRRERYHNRLHLASNDM